MLWRAIAPEGALPTRVVLIYAVEMAERFNYYGMASLLTLFLTGGPPQLEPAHAAAVFSFFTAAAYLAPLLGSAAAATKLRIFGTIVVFSMVYLGGMLLLPLAASAEASQSLSRWLAGVALALIALGTGGIKPNVAAFGAMQMGDSSDSAQQQTDGGPSGAAGEHEEARLQSFFSTFYFCINAGAISGQLAVPAVQRVFGYAASFLSSSCVLVMAILLFLGGQYVIGSGYIHEAAARPVHGQTLSMPEQVPGDGRSSGSLSEIGVQAQPTWAEFFRIAVASRLGGNWPRAHRLHGADRCALVTESMLALRMLCIMPLFWAGHSSMGSVWIVQADRLSLPLGLSAAQWSAINPIGVLVGLPACAAASRALGVRRQARVTIGFGLGCFALVLSAAMQLWIEKSVLHDSQGPSSSGRTTLPQIDGAWTIPQWIFLAIAEVLASVSSLEAAYAGAPPTLRSGMQAAWLAASAAGSVISGVVFAILGDGSKSLALLAFGMAAGAFSFSRVSLSDPEVHCSREASDEEDALLVPGNP